MIYVPDDLLYDSCYVMESPYILRVYENVPVQDSVVNYIDVATDNHYLYSEGVADFHTLSVPSCLSSDRLTSAWSYRTDFFEILGCLLILIFGVGYLITRPLKWLFRGSV